MGSSAGMFRRERLSQNRGWLLRGLAAGAALLAATLLPNATPGRRGLAAGPQPPASAPATTATARPRDLFRASGIGDDQLQQFQDGVPLRETETKPLVNILSCLEGLQPETIERWAGRPLDFPQLGASPATARGEIFSLRGRVVSLDPVRLAADAAGQLEGKTCYRSVLLLDDPKLKAVVYTGRIPAAWRRGGAPGERIAADGLFLKLAGSSPAELLPLLASPRLAWYPPTPLGELAFDVGLLDDVADAKALTSSDREGFYGMLAAVRRASPGQLLRQAKEEPRQAGWLGDSAVPLFNDPAGQRGRLVWLSGRAGRVVRIEVNDPEIASRFHLDHYYEIDLFPADSQGNPVVFCVPEVPEDMVAGGASRRRGPIEVAGFFFKLWRYPVERGSGGAVGTPGKVPMQSAPLLLGQTPAWRPQTRSSGPMAPEAVIGALLAMVLIGVWLLLWHLRQTDTEFYEKWRAL